MVTVVAAEVDVASEEPVAVDAAVEDVAAEEAEPDVDEDEEAAVVDDVVVAAVVVASVVTAATVVDASVVAFGSFVSSNGSSQLTSMQITQTIAKKSTQNRFIKYLLRSYLDFYISIITDALKKSK